MVIIKSRELAALAVYNILDKGAFSNIYLSKELDESCLDSKDKALVTEIVYGTIKYRYTIDKILDSLINSEIHKLDPLVLNILRTAIYQIKYLDKVPEFAIVNEAVDISKNLSGFSSSKLVNGVLRNYLRTKDTTNYINENYLIDRLCFQYSFDKWMVELFINQYGRSQAECILKGLNNIPVNTVRVNELKISYHEAYNKLEELGFNIKKGYILKEAINILKGGNIEKNPLFIEGKITIQDESAMLVAKSMDIKTNQTILDLCSAPGGKTTHISEIMGNSGTIKAFDIHRNKLDKIKENYDRLGLSNIYCEVLDATIFNEDLVDSSDRVLIDVPCSGLGIIRKKPEIKWNKTMSELKELKQIQMNILMNASKYVKKQGILLYSTCTLNKNENEKNIDAFLKNNTNYVLEPLYFGDKENIIYSEKGYVTILPNEYMDGFFIAKMRRCL